MQIVANADERKSLFEELSHAACAKQEQTQNDFIFLRRVDQDHIDHVINTSLAVFGANRCIYGSNFPPELSANRSGWS